MIWIDHSPHSGREMAGQHPFLVLSPRAFNVKTGLVIGCAMTSKQAHNPFAVANPRDPALESYILADQPKSFDWRMRGGRPHPDMEVPDAAFAQVLLVVNQILQLG